MRRKKKGEKEEKGKTGERDRKTLQTKVGVGQNTQNLESFPPQSPISITTLPLNRYVILGKSLNFTCKMEIIALDS